MCLGRGWQCACIRVLFFAISLCAQYQQVAAHMARLQMGGAPAGYPGAPVRATLPPPPYSLTSRGDSDTCGPSLTGLISRGDADPRSTLRLSPYWPYLLWGCFACGPPLAGLTSCGDADPSYSPLKFLLRLEPCTVLSPLLCALRCRWLPVHCFTSVFSAVLPSML